MRHPEPQWLIDWRNEYEKGPPRCCHTCEAYDESGRCTYFDMVPPAEFAGDRQAQCSQWLFAVPF